MHECRTPLFLFKGFVCNELLVADDQCFGWRHRRDEVWCFQSSLISVRLVSTMQRSSSDEGCEE